MLSGHSVDKNVHKFWKTTPKFFLQLDNYSLKKGEELFKVQMDHLANALLVDDYNPLVNIKSCVVTTDFDIKFPAGALLSGSFIAHMASYHLSSAPIKYDDIDVYFKKKEDAIDFIQMNQGRVSSFDLQNPMCSYGYLDDETKINLIYGVPYADPGDLISRFDIRACSMAFDPNTKTLYCVEGALEDATQKHICFNAVPRGCSIRRLTKYIQKGFQIDGHQALFFAELVKTPIYSPQLELVTKKY